MPLVLPYSRDAVPRRHATPRFPHTALPKLHVLLTAFPPPPPPPITTGTGKASTSAVSRERPDDSSTP
jgi:hypothetical protein